MRKIKPKKENFTSVVNLINQEFDSLSDEDKREILNNLYKFINKNNGI